MRSLLRYIIRNYAFLLFVLLEIISLVFVFNNNNYQKSKYLNSSNRMVASIYGSFNSVVNYFGLAETNRQLAQENADMKTRLMANSQIRVIPDTVFTQLDRGDIVYRFISARVINNSVNKPYNYITLDKGRKHGIKPDQGIVSADGIVGVITEVTDSYSLGLSVLNQRWSISAKLKKSGFFGSLSWEGLDYRTANLMEIPFHVDLAIGDTVVTSSYSSIFPEGVNIGTIQSFTQPGGENYYNIKVKLATNFKALSFVDVIDNLGKDEIEELDNLIQDGAVSN